MIAVEDLCYSIGNTPVLDRIALSIETGRMLAMVGPSGAGKTSLLRIMAGLQAPTRGKIEWRAAGSRNGSFKVAMIFQSLALWPHMNAREHLEFVIDRKKYQKAAFEEKIGAMFKSVHLADREQRYPHELSGGELQRLAIARALATDPDLLLMDEPFSNLDEALKDELIDLTMDLKKRNGITIVYVTHNIKEATAAADRIVLLKAGRIVRSWDDIHARLDEEILRAMRSPTC